MHEDSCPLQWLLLLNNTLSFILYTTIIVAYKYSSIGFRATTIVIVVFTVIVDKREDEENGEDASEEDDKDEK